MKLTRMFESPKLDSRIKSRNVTGQEKVLGYLIGPAGVIIFNHVLNSYLNVFYTDALGATKWLGGLFLVLFPIISKVIDAITNLVMADIIDKTRTRQGKLRPFILMSIPVLFLSAIMLFAIPNIGQAGQMIWIVVSYNLYYSVAYTMYTISQQMLVATSTRNSDQRTVLGIFNSLSMFGIGGAFAFAIFPMMIYPMMQKDPTKWLPIMSIIAAFILPLTCIQYFYTRERVTEEDNALAAENAVEKRSMIDELKMLITNKSWLFFMLAIFMKELAIKIGNSGTIYYTNWVLASDYTQGNGYFATMNMVGGGMAGMLMTAFTWPLAKKLGKNRLMVLSMLMMAGSMAVCWLCPGNWPLVLLFFFLAQCGSSLSSYVTYSMLADVIDEAEWKFGHRSDAISGAAMSVMITVTAGLGTGLFNGVLSMVDYQTPAALLQVDGTYGAQTATVQGAITFMTFGICAIIYALSAFFFAGVKSEKNLPMIQKELMERKKAAAAAAGIEWVDPVEAANREALADIEKNYEVELEKLQKKYAGNSAGYEKAKAKLDKKFQSKKEKVGKH